MGSHVLEASTLNAATGERAHQYERLREQFQTLKTEFAKIADDSDFEGKGAEAIKGFYQGQIDVVDAWIQLIEINVLFFKGIPGDTEEVNLSGDTVVQVPFLEENVERAGRMAKDIITDQQDALQRIFSDISDLVSLSVFSKDAFEDEMHKAEKRRSETVEKVIELDQRLTGEYAVSQGQEQYIYALFAQLMEATRQGETISPLYFDAEAYHNSEVYKAITKVKEENDKYINFKKELKEAREIQKEMEEMENRPWYEKAWDTVSTFTGEVTGYYDSIRASTGVDPVTGRKLSEAERITAGAMAAAGFIPVIGWAGRAVKGGSAIYKTVKAANTADYMLDSYKTAQGLTRLQKAEYGIYGLVSANGFGEYFTGKDMFGNELSEEQRNQSLFNAFAIAGVGSAGYALDRMDFKKILPKKPIEKISEVDREKLKGWDYPPDEEKYLKYKKVYDNPKYYDQSTGMINWPPNNGFKGNPEIMVLEKGKLIDRYGAQEGNFFSPEGIEYEKRALALHSDEADYYIYQVITPLEVTGGEIAPWFDRVGGGTQYIKYHDNGEMYSMKQLMDEGYIVEISVKKGGIIND
ncbi:T7SS effector LXG polymorphic toxin [Fictibacillus phosphorivorans]|uniref:T7SS effector LXG polymorphic toxin n=1 Tax=Fictibacillus phosphorivorans TaxID=1221500 RepID=UPI001293EE77|nr:T7SS effector LXG polymorphic toxin [Fictibacillus phosphorivorans]MQR96024.1 DUF4237 domain-containing protein [Fictibacillus phosphorivorans]